VSRHRRIAAFAVAAALTASSSAQEPLPQDRTERPRFRGGVELVQLDVSVLDSDRRPVSGLTAADFTVLENGRERPIRAFTPVRLPPRPDPRQRGSAALQSDVATNDAARQDGRLVFILMDRTIPAGEPTLTAKRVAVAAIETLGPTDLAAVITTGAGVPQTLTANRTRLIAAVNRSDWSTGISKEQEDIIGKEDPLSDGRCLCGLCVLETITRISDAVRHVPRRRKLLLFIGSRMIFQVGFRAPASDVE
jgi:VWFA-related protein